LGSQRSIALLLHSDWNAHDALAACDAGFPA
jgi:hypothetical protein